MRKVYTQTEYEYKTIGEAVKHIERMRNKGWYTLNMETLHPRCSFDRVTAFGEWDLKYDYIYHLDDCGNGYKFFARFDHDDTNA